MNDNNNQTCEFIQLSISDAIDANVNICSADAQHIEHCHECAEFHQLWQADSAISTIASGSLIEQENLALPILTKLEQDKKVLRGKFFNISSVAAVAAAVAIVSAFTFYGMKQDDASNGGQNIADTAKSEETLNLKIPKLELNLTESNIEKSLEENYHHLSVAATDKWKTATTSIARATEYIANGTHYISTKYLAPHNGNDSPSGPQSQLAPEQDAPDQPQYG